MTSPTDRLVVRRRANRRASRRLKKLQLRQIARGRNLVVPVSGDFGGPKAIRAIGAYVRAQGGVVSAFYLSNVEQYLFQDRKDCAFYDNVAALPTTGRVSSSGLLAAFASGDAHPLCAIDDFLDGVRGGCRRTTTRSLAHTDRGCHAAHTSADVRVCRSSRRTDRAACHRSTRAVARFPTPTGSSTIGRNCQRACNGLGHLGGPRRERQHLGIPSERPTTSSSIHREARPASAPACSRKRTDDDRP